MPRTLREFLARPLTSAALGRVVSVKTALPRRGARGMRETAKWSIAPASTPATLRHASMARSGKPAQGFTRRKRSSSTAATSRPSLTITAEALPW